MREGTASTCTPGVDDTSACLEHCGGRLRRHHQRVHKYPLERSQQRRHCAAWHSIVKVDVQYYCIPLGAHIAVATKGVLAALSWAEVCQMAPTAPWGSDSLLMCLVLL
eukprot:CAMPEP_0172782546 /NCGR_PEP_ID=MMETSP1074-20121228/203987_1 /TAXON_ID=2916 /ORGANISM="Ceratium fusus, Strain PA161109" /LENGTH=107 /DNA_ID=CAMNT_0013619529 /DNA_START=1880 /DNA_END=2204 /DNA_ORIENTATION=+